MILPLQKTCIYGPINSRRLGRSLGINILPPDKKLCTLNCIYCQYGETKINDNGFPEPKLIIDTVEEVIGQEPEIDHITFSGNGEPMLHPQFNIIVDGIKKIRDIIIPHVPIALLTNGTEFSESKKREALKSIDKVIVKVDAGNDNYFQKVNQPMIPLVFNDFIKFLETHSPIFTQTLFFEGELTNCDKTAVAVWFEVLGILKPKIAQIYSLDRPSLSNIKPVPYARLKQIAKEGQQTTGVKIEAYGR